MKYSIDYVVRLLVTLIIIYTLLRIGKCLNYLAGKDDMVEGFDNFTDDYVDPFDEVYVKLYSKVFNNTKLIKYNIDQIDTKTIINANTKKINILDAGCGAGLTYKLINDDYKKVGVDSSGYFIRLANVRNPLGDFITGNLKNEKLFEPKTFTHVLSFFDSLYHNNINDMKIILGNYNKWLKRNGYLCIHIFDKNKLDPTPRDFSQFITDKDNIKHSITYFNTFTHDAWWGHDTNDKNVVKYNEKFVLTNGHNKIHSTTLYIPPIKETIKLIMDSGFRLVSIIDMSNFNIDDIELYIFKKRISNKN
jgi:SAM-dependent methyltransferase